MAGMSKAIPSHTSPVLSDDMLTWVKSFRQQAVASMQRRALVLSGDRSWCETFAREVVHGLACESSLWVSAHNPQALPPEKARTQLGKEYDVIVFDAFDQLHADAFGAVSGTLRGGGLFLLLMPLQQDWSVLQSSRFHQRALPLLQHHEGLVFLQQGQVLPDVIPVVPGRNPEPDVVEPFCTVEQQQVVQAIEAMALNKQAQAMVLISDRGRGKSSALGLAAGYLLHHGIHNILVTAPRLSTSDPVFQHAQRLCPNAISSRGQLRSEQGSLQFMAPDALLIEKPQADLLLVDEAAAIPIQLLQQFLQHYPAVVFATTIHGYEGTGRGFTLKFSKILDTLSPGWQQYKLETPVRWAQHDPVEAWVDRVLCMHSELQTVPDVHAIDQTQCQVKLIDRDLLLKQEERLSALFALLVNAHYRTQPSDLRHMLDDPQVRVYTLEYQQFILAAVLINEEGGFDDALSTKIYRGERRPAGNLLAQTLCFHAGCESAATLKYARVMRIAVHPQLQGQGLGSHLLREVIVQERPRVAAIGTSFGASVELLRFWRRAGFELVRMGFTRDHASGTHSAVMLQALNAQGQTVFTEVRNRFQHYLAVWLQGPLRDLPDDIKQDLQQEQQSDEPALSDDDWKEIHSFVNTHRSYEATLWPIIKLLKQHKADVELLDEQDRRVIQVKVIDHKDWALTAHDIHASGKADAVKSLRRALNNFLDLIRMAGNQ